LFVAGVAAPPRVPRRAAWALLLARRRARRALTSLAQVKGQIAEMAKCLDEPDARISELAKLFFAEMAAKDNAVYNNLPDIISGLSAGDNALDEDAFRRVVDYIFSFVQKDKQAENLVEKLCNRFRQTDVPRQWRDLAFCLSRLSYTSDKAVKKLIEGCGRAAPDAGPRSHGPRQACQAIRTSCTTRRSSTTSPTSWPRRASSRRRS
jgi:hypothetical protein